MKLKLKDRSIVRIAGAHYLSLPIIWIRSMGLKKGMKIKIDMKKDGELVLEAKKK